MTIHLDGTLVAAVLVAAIILVGLGMLIWALAWAATETWRLADRALLARAARRRKAELAEHDVRRTGRVERTRSAAAPPALPKLDMHLPIADRDTRIARDVGFVVHMSDGLGGWRGNATIDWIVGEVKQRLGKDAVITTCILIGGDNPAYYRTPSTAHLRRLLLYLVKRYENEVHMISVGRTHGNEQGMERMEELARSADNKFWYHHPTVGWKPMGDHNVP